MKKFLKRVLIAAATGAAFYVFVNLVSGTANLIFTGQWSYNAPVYTLPMPYILYAAVIFALAAWYVAVGVLTVGCAAGYAIGPYYGSLSMYNNGGMLTLTLCAFSFIAAILVQLIYNFIKRKIDENTPA